MSLNAIIPIAIIYMLALCVLAWLTDQGRVPRHWLRHPLIYVLALGVYGSAWTFYGAVGLAYNYGISFLAAYLGSSLAFILAPVIFIPIIRLCHTYQLSSLADLFAFRFRSRQAGVLTTLLMLVSAIPMLSIQIQAVADSTHILNPTLSESSLALGFCVLIALFAILFGARHPSIRDKHEGLVFSMAIKSLVKLIAMLAIAIFILWSVFANPKEMLEWLEIGSLNRPTPLHDDAWRTLILAFFASVIVMPHMFHIAFTENLNTRALRQASWGMPLFLLLMCLPIPLIVWAGARLGLDGNAEYLILLIGLSEQAPILTTLAYLGGLSAASGIVIVSVLALSAMVLNHLLLPTFQPNPKTDFYRWLLWSKRALIIALIWISYLFYSWVGQSYSLHLQGMIAFVAFLQFLPGLLATLFWPRGHRQGFTWGMLVGMGYWLISMLLPLVTGAGDAPELSLHASHWHESALYSLTLNVLIFAVVSIYAKSSAKEQYVAQACALNALPGPSGKQVMVTSCQDFVLCLTPHLGIRTAELEVQQALEDLGLEADDHRPASLRRLRDRLEANLSGLLGPSEAEDILNMSLPYQGEDSLYKANDIHIIESQLSQYQSRLTGLAAELDSLRRFHRNILQHLPIGVCALGEGDEIALWNQTMVQYTGLEAEQVLGSRIQDLPAPWQGLLGQFLSSQENRHHNACLEQGHQQRWFSLQRVDIHAQMDETPVAEHSVILVEDETDTKLLADRLAHSERLISIGRLAAGVAHEIGNPVTGIACLAQNLRYETEQPEVLEIAEQQLQQTARISRILQSLLSFSHTGQQTDPAHYQRLSIYECVQEAINLLRLDARAHQVEFTNHCQLSHEVMGDAQRLVQVFINLLNNARDASPDGSQVEIRTRLDDFSVYIEVEDQGSGIPPEHLEHLFEPFFTTKDAGQGTGLGLSLVYTIINEHYGNIEVTSRTAATHPDQPSGTCFTLTLPRPATPETTSEV